MASSSILENSPNYRIGTAKRNVDLSNGTPGPGTYERNGNSEGPRWVFGSDKRDKEIAKRDGPGPGSYNEFIIKDPKAFSMSPKNPKTEQSLSPGPGTYSPSKRTETPLFSIGKGPKNSQSFKNELPGPGSYESRTWTEDFTKSVKFGTDTRRPLSSKSPVPGPGTYTTAGKPGEGPAYTMRSRTTKKVRSDVPVRLTQGPGTYSQNISDFVYETSPRNKFGTSKRSSTNDSGNPIGPGMYDIRGKFIGPKWGFGSGPRSELRQKSESPGPGAYSIKPTLPDLPSYVKTF